MSEFSLFVLQPCSVESGACEDMTCYSPQVELQNVTLDVGFRCRLWDTIKKVKYSYYSDLVVSLYCKQLQIYVFVFAMINCRGMMLTDLSSPAMPMLIINLFQYKKIVEL